MNIEILEEGAGIKITDSKCFCCGGSEFMTNHHAFPKCLNPKRNVEVPACSKCHEKINEVDLQGIAKFLFKIGKRLDTINLRLQGRRY